MKPKITDISQLAFSKTYTDYLTWRFQERVELIKGRIYKISPAPRLFIKELKVLPTYSYRNF
ncbi:hypothetical protein LB452_02260 [Psychroflexus sp. CAK8W]|uniref:Uncharacterized protein n=1 Tax=Psychroflexus longus TaxID=2873596 RepID=A0ABS7XFK6_9FLAO|nr:hypothetical protein [Psychroflexus longus]MBZ9777734.1 hypothetical protein [Psychroflexus longus]